MRKLKRSATEDDPLLTIRSRKNLGVSSRATLDEIDKIIDYSKASAHQNLRRQLNSLFEQPSFDFTLKTVNGLLSIVLVIQYIYSLYDTEPFEGFLWGFISFLIHLYLFLEYVVRLLSAKDITKYFFSLEGRIDIISNLPILIIKAASGDPFYDDPTSIIAKIGNMMSILRLLRLESYQRFIENEVNRQLTNIILTISTLILFASACLQMMQTIQVEFIDPDTDSERDKIDLPYQFYVFSIIITISTLGYANNFPGALAKIFLIFLIFVSLFIIPTKSSQLISIFSSKSVYARMRYKITEQIQHIIVTGTVSNASALDFFNELFHSDHGGQSRHGILLLPNPPDSAMESMIRNKEFGSNVFYIQGDPLKEADLRRCQADRASAIIILCNKQSSDANEEDAKTILQAMFIKKFLKHAKANNVKVCMQILRPEGKTHYYLSLNKQTKSDQVLCVEELKLSLLAKSCLCPGLVALIANLIASSGEPPKRSETDNEWLEDYWHGKGFEVYKVYLASAFHGEKFAWVAAKIYKKFRAILFALELGTGDNARIYNNPGDYVLPGGSRITAYVISEDKEIADAISKYKLGTDDVLLMSREIRKNPALRRRTTMNRFTFTSNVMERSGSLYMDEKSDGEEEERETDFPTKLKQENFNQHLTGEFMNLEEAFHLASSKINLSDVTFKTMENNILVTNHIILCGLVSNLRNFVLPLRAKYLDKYPPIVILHVHPPTEKQWNQISYFPEIYFVKGSAMNTKDLLRANIQHASRIVILSPEVDEVKHFASPNENQNVHEEADNRSKKLTRDQEDLLDAKTIFKYKAISKLRPDIHIVTELVSPQNLGFLIGNAKDYSIMKKYGQVNTPLFASGSIYLSSMIDNLICQAYYNPSLITVLNQLIVGNATPKAKTANPSFGNDIRGSNLYHFQVPKSFVGQSFAGIFEYLSKRQNIIPIGLYRLGGVRGNKFPYVMTNPDPGTLLTEKDVMFILSQKAPPTSKKGSEWGAPLETKSERKDSVGTQLVKLGAPQLELANNYEEVGKENLKNKRLKMESEFAMEKKKEVEMDIKRVRENIERLKDELKNRPQKILGKIKRVMEQQITEMMPEENMRKKLANEQSSSATDSPDSSVTESR